MSIYTDHSMLEMVEEAISKWNEALAGQDQRQLHDKRE